MWGGVGTPPFFNPTNMIYDIILTGYGAAGLSMLHHLLQTTWENKSILIIDTSLTEKIKKTWCFWEDKHVPYQCAKKFYWKKLRVLGERDNVTQSLKRNTYYHIKSEDLYQEISLQISDKNNITFVAENVKKFREIGDKIEVITESTTYNGRYVVNSIPGLNREEKTNYKLTQNFLGWKVAVNAPIFDEDTATLMDFRGGSDPASFFYVLPYSRYYALVEFTRFSEKVTDIAHYELNLKAYLKDKLGIEDYEIMETEFGVIPMTDYPYKSKLSKRVFQLGTIGGDTKPTTGYTFKQIQKSCKDILNEIIYKKAQPKKQKRFAFYDKLLLNIIAQKPALTESIMLSLFKNNRFDDIFRFLDEESSLFQEMKIFSRLPWKPFIQSLLSKKTPLYDTSTKVNSDATGRSIIQFP